MENAPTPESTEKRLIIGELRNLTPEDIAQSIKEPGSVNEKVKRLEKWAVEWESLISALNDPDEVTMQQIKFEMERADLYKEAGLLDFTRDALHDAIVLAGSTGHYDIVNMIKEKLDALE